MSNLRQDIIDDRRYLNLYFPPFYFFDRDYKQFCLFSCHLLLYLRSRSFQYYIMFINAVRFSNPGGQAVMRWA